MASAPELRRCPAAKPRRRLNARAAVSQGVLGRLVPGGRADVALCEALENLVAGQRRDAVTGWQSVNIRIT